VVQSIENNFGSFAGYAAALPAAGISQIRRLSAVKYIEADSMGRIELNTEKYGNLDAINTQKAPPSWGLSRVSQRELLNSSTPYFFPDPAGQGSTVYVIDTGVQGNHSDFEGRAVLVKNFVLDEPAQDLHSHGTHVSGTVVSRTYGVAKNARVKAIKVCNLNGGCQISDIISGIQFAVNDANASQGSSITNIISMSLGVAPSQALDDAVNAAVEKRVAVVCSAGNGSGKDSCTDSPRRAAGAFAVGSISKTDSISSFSNIGKCIKIFAPGSDIISLVLGNDGNTGKYSGTSMATPHVAGIMAILAAQGFYANVEDLYTKTLNVATKGVVIGLDANTANLLAYNNYDDYPQQIQRNST